MEVAVVKIGVIPLPQTIFGEIVPEKRILAAPPVGYPKLKYVAVPEPPVPMGKFILETGLATFVATLKPPVVLATVTLAYPVYPISLEVMLPVAVGSAVWRATAIVVIGDDAVLSAKVDMFVAFKISLSKSSAVV